MNKLGVILLAVLLFASAGASFAAWDFDDPALCVAGQWMMVDAADPSAVFVALPAGTAYGNQKQGGCPVAAPAKLLPRSHVVASGDGNSMEVTVDGTQATPRITVSYGTAIRTAENHGGTYVFRFRLPR